MARARLPRLRRLCPSFYSTWLVVKRNRVPKTVGSKPKVRHASHTKPACLTVNRKRPQGIEKRPQPLCRSARLDQIQQQTGSKSQTTKPKPTLPSPSASNTPSKEAGPSSLMLCEANSSEGPTKLACPSQSCQFSRVDTKVQSKSPT